MNITQETRRAAYDGIQDKAQKRRDLILMILKHGPATAEEITAELHTHDFVPYFDMNFVRPRLTELCRAGKIKPVGKRISERTGKQTAVWAVNEQQG